MQLLRQINYSVLIPKEVIGRSFLDSPNSANFSLRAAWMNGGDHAADIPAQRGDFP